VNASATTAIISETITKTIRYKENATLAFKDMSVQVTVVPCTVSSITIAKMTTEVGNKVESTV
jgi:hypothetical protein